MPERMWNVESQMIGGARRGKEVHWKWSIMYLGKKKKRKEKSPVSTGQSIVIPSSFLGKIHSFLHLHTRDTFKRSILCIVKPSCIYKCTLRGSYGWSTCSVWFCFSCLWTGSPEKRGKLEGEQERAEMNAESILEWNGPFGLSEHLSLSLSLPGPDQQSHPTSGEAAKPPSERRLSNFGATREPRKSSRVYLKAHELGLAGPEQLQATEAYL